MDEVTMSLWFDGTYGGKKYTPGKTFRFKKDAEAVAREMRKKGYSVRIYSPEGVNGKMHDIYYRRK
jgi:hypothetical protein